MKRDEFVEATVDAGHWLERNWRAVAAVGGLLVMGVLAVFVWVSWRERAQIRSGAVLGEGMRLYQRAQEGGFADVESLGQALTAFDTAIDRAGGTKPGRVARYYRGATLYRMGRYDEAVEPLQSVADSQQAPSTLRGGAKALLAEVYEAQGQREQAIETLEGVVAADPPEYPVDQALLRLGSIYAEQGDADKARECWQRVVDDFAGGSAATEARKLLEG